MKPTKSPAHGLRGYTLADELSRHDPWPRRSHAERRYDRACRLLEGLGWILFCAVCALSLFLIYGGMYG